MRRAALTALSFITLVACAPSIPDSGAGVGFDSYAEYQAQREAELIANGEGGVSANSLNGPAVSSAPLDDTSSLANDALAAIGQEASASTAQVAQTTRAVPAAVQNAAGISAENDFDAVASERSIAQDAARVAANRDSYTVIQPKALSGRPSGSRTSLVQFALSTTNQVGQPLYSRLTIRAQSRAARNCAKFASPDLAQEAFLEGGGPQRNVKGMDPDGDGFACSWDPSPFRTAVR